MSRFLEEIFPNLIKPGTRINWLEKLLLEEIWSAERYQKFSPAQYLEKGEAEINHLEEIIAATSSRLYDELVKEPQTHRNALNFLESPGKNALVIFDGLSLREIPVLLAMTEKAKLRINEIGITYSSLPTETIDFIEQRLKLGRISPSQLPVRKELKEKGISAYYYPHPNQLYPLDPASEKLFLWSAFPDNTYSDCGARFAQHFEQINTLLETAWLNTVQQIPRGFKILITSDHGYIYLGAGLSFARSNNELKPLTQYLGGERYRRFSSEEGNPPVHPDLAVFPELKLAVLKGRIQTHPPGQAASRLYKHGGLSIMEILVPWILLEAN